MKRPRDSQRQRLYDAEILWSVQWGLNTPDMTIEECQAYVNKVLRSVFWKSRCDIRQLPVNATWGNWARATKQSKGLSIRLPEEMRTPAIILHELCHHLTGTTRRQRVPVAVHGREFAANELDLVRRFIGANEAQGLKAQYKAHGVRYTRPRRKL